MNFKVSKSEDYFFTFHYLDGKNIETNFNQLVYNGDNYVLAKNNFSNYFTLLDLNGESIHQEINVVNRFENGNLLIYEWFFDERESRDGNDISKTYHVYKIFDFDSKKTKTLFAIDDIYFNPKAIFFNPRTDGLEVKHLFQLFGKKIYLIGNVIFSDIFDNEWIIIADLKYENFEQFDIDYRRPLINSFFYSIWDNKIWCLHNINEPGISTSNHKSIKNLDYKQLLNQLTSLIKVPILSNPKSNFSFNKDSEEVKNFEVISIYKKYNT